MTIALQVFVTGLAAGGVYGLFAAGHALVYRLTGIVHFAFGDLVGLGVFATLLVLAGTAPVTQAGAYVYETAAARGPKPPGAGESGHGGGNALLLVLVVAGSVLAAGGALVLWAHS